MSTTSRHLAGMFSVNVKTRTGEIVCPACGGLQCLCRPRFFAGQLLTEEDLNRLERYIVEKNKLHNRYLHGWGVACGLEVVCHECKGYVMVRSGYALSPCGDDIVVCQDTAVNVCDLINQCKEQREWDCDPAWPPRDPICGDDDEPWILYLCYDETPSRGVTALRGGSGSSCCSRCSCGGSSSCGCGCHPSTNGKSNGNGHSKCASKPTTTTRTAQQQCEPTLTCESYSFRLRKAPTRERREFGELINRLRTCLRELVKLEQELLELARLGRFHAFQETALEYLEHHSIHNCELVQALVRLREQLETGGANTVGGQTPAALIRRFVVEIFRDCVCSAILPPCPEPVEDNCVPLATLTINCKDGCHIKRVCNWEHRRHVLTFPNFEYWLEFLFRKSGLSEIIAELCCGPIRRRDFQTDATFVAPPTSIWDSMFEEAARAQGEIPAKSIYQRIGTVMKGFMSRLAGNP